MFTSQDVETAIKQEKENRKKPRWSSACPPCCDHTKKYNTKIKAFVYKSRVETAIKQEENRKEPLRNRWLFYMILCSLVCLRKASSKFITTFFLSSGSPYRYSLAIDYISTQINLTTFSIPELKTGTYLM